MPILARTTSTSRCPGLRPAGKPDEKLSDGRLGEASVAIRARVEAARARQRQRFQGHRGLLANANSLMKGSPAALAFWYRYAGTKPAFFA